MRFPIEIHIHRFPELDAVLTELKHLNRKADQIMKTQAELAQDLRDVNAQQKKTLTEIQTQSTTLQQKIADLEKIIADGGAVTPELEQAVADVKAQAQVVDDAIPDATIVPPQP